jgi:hypothetical protein
MKTLAYASGSMKTLAYASGSMKTLAYASGSMKTLAYASGSMGRQRAAFAVLDRWPTPNVYRAGAVFPVDVSIRALKLLF